jgi:cytidyltransferase-like protein
MNDSLQSRQVSRKPLIESSLETVDMRANAEWAVRRSAHQPETVGQILSLQQFGQIRDQIDLGRIVATSGCFDPIHYGHGRSLLAARQLGDTLVVIVNGDEYLANKKTVPFQDLQTRCATLAFMKGVDYVIPYEVSGDTTVIGALRVIRPHIFAKGGDRSNPESVPEFEVLDSLGAKMEFGVGGAAKDVSSSDILRSYRERLRLSERTS